MKKLVKRNKLNCVTFVLTILLLCLIISGCNSNPNKEIVEKLVRSRWSSQGASTFLINKVTNLPYNSVGLSSDAQDVSSKATIDEIEIIEKKDADEKDSKNKEVRMIIKVSGSVEAYKLIRTGNEQKDQWSELLNHKNVSIGVQKFSVSSYYYFSENKYGEWSMSTEGKNASN